MTEKQKKAIERVEDLLWNHKAAEGDKETEDALNVVLSLARREELNESAVENFLLEWRDKGALEYVANVAYHLCFRFCKPEFP